MKLLFFKTDVVSCEKIESIRNELNHFLGFRNWNFDLEDPNRIFKVEILNTSPDEIIDLLKKLGVACIEDKNYKLKSNDIRKTGNIETVKKCMSFLLRKTTMQ